MEALVALALIVMFAAVLNPTLFQARRIMEHSANRVAAHVLLRALIDAPLDRANMAAFAREGETGGLRWRLISQPIADATGPRSRSGSTPARPPSPSAFRVVASVFWGGGHVVTAETVRLGAAP